MSEAPSTSSTSRISLFRSSTTLLDGKVRTVCKYGTKCYRRNPEHLKAECHPYDPDYLDCCKQSGTTPEFTSVRSLFYWCDDDGSGKATRDDIAKVWDILCCYGEGIGDLTEEIWHQIDDDGNGYVNFSEFAELTTMMKVDLPLGLDELINANGETTFRCGVYGCACSNFQARRRRCKYAETCYQTNLDHKTQFCHPVDADWEADYKHKDENMCICGHKRQLHKSSAEGAGTVPYPAYWTETTEDGTEFNKLVSVEEADFPKFQTLLDTTYSDKTTRDRERHTGSWMVPRGYRLISAQRNENSKLWRKYCIRKAELQKEKEIEQENPELAKERGLEYTLFDDVDTSKALQSSNIHSEQLNEDINEWYLFHGTSASAAINICKNDFKMRLAGSATGTLYGRGSYLAESITKADEYSKLEGDVHTVLLCRVLGGRVKYTAEREPDPDELTKACVEGPFDCIVGDRKKISGTYREFIVFDAENVFPEYILKYQRGELFKSSSFPGFAGAK